MGNMKQTTTTTAEKTKFCKHCGEKIPEDAAFCTSCGKQVKTMVQAVIPNITIINNSNANANANVGGRMPKPINKGIALLLCVFLGYFGAHKFYEGRIGLGIVYLFTFGFFGIGWAIDTIVLLLKPNIYYV